MIGVAAVVAILLSLFAIDRWAQRLIAAAYVGCSCAYPDPDGSQPLCVHRCRSCGNWWDPLHCAPRPTPGTVVHEDDAA